MQATETILWDVRPYEDAWKGVGWVGARVTAQGKQDELPPGLSKTSGYREDQSVMEDKGGSPWERPCACCQCAWFFPVGFEIQRRASPRRDGVGSDGERKGCWYSTWCLDKVVGRTLKPYNAQFLSWISNVYLPLLM